MQISPFILEQYFAKHEFTARYMLSSSDCDGFPMEYILEHATEKELEMWKNLTLGYTEGMGSRFLRESVCRFYKKAKPENVLVASPGELSFILMNVLMERSAGCGSDKPHAVVVSPAYQSLYEVLKSLDCDISYWRASCVRQADDMTVGKEDTCIECGAECVPGSEDTCGESGAERACGERVSGGEWRFDIEELKKLVRPDTRLIVINFPHNPTGAYITRKQLDEIVEIARSCGAYLYSDEMYRDLIVNDGVEPLPAVCDIYEKGISLWGTAKSFGLAGLRIGWFVSQDTGLLARIQSFKDYLSICCSAPSEVLTAIALNHSDEFIGPNVEKIRSNVAFFKEAVGAGKLPFVTDFIPPVAGSVAFVGIDPAKAAYLLDFTPATALEFSDSVVEKYGIMTVPAPMFEASGNWLRIGFGRENFKEVVSTLFCLQNHQ
ncbi:MAG: aminotransferase class I/II-fold pyridoxal phosphate-dependent enzyme [Bacteroidales bacterium]|nr:aminotransferase class I/II-fold pyridoxal phosphate-dependent enzyme [Bacteroidales bacterium]